MLGPDPEKGTEPVPLGKFPGREMLAQWRDEIQCNFPMSWEGPAQPRRGFQGREVAPTSIRGYRWWISYFNSVIYGPGERDPCISGAAQRRQTFWRNWLRIINVDFSSFTRWKYFLVCPPFTIVFVGIGHRLLKVCIFIVPFCMYFLLHLRWNAAPQMEGNSFQRFSSLKKRC